MFLQLLDARREVAEFKRGQGLIEDGFCRRDSRRCRCRSVFGNLLEYANRRATVGLELRDCRLNRLPPECAVLSLKLRLLKPTPECHFRRTARGGGFFERTA